jgi:hypothetical protein
MNFNEKSAKYLKAREKLPKELQGVYTQLVDEYAYHALQLYGRNWVAYDVIAALVLDGWRSAEEN